VAKQLAYFSLVLASFVHTWAQENPHVLERVFICIRVSTFRFAIHIVGRLDTEDGLWIPILTLPEELQLSVLNKSSVCFLVSHFLT